MNLRTLTLVFFFLALSQIELTAQQSLHMTMESHWDVDTLPTRSGFQYNDIWGYSDCYGNEYAIMGSALYVHFLALDAGDEPVEVAHFPGFSTTIWRDFKTYRDRAYAVADNNSDGLMVFDMSHLPDSVSKSNHTNEFFDQAHNIFIDEAHGRAYVVGTNTLSNGVIILDLTENPDEPQLLSNTTLSGGYVHDIYVKDHIGYCSHGNNGLSVYNFEDPANPVFLGSIQNYPESGYNHSSWVTADNNYMVFADETFGRSLKMTDISDLQDMEITDLFKSTLLAPDFTNSIAHNPFIRDHYVIISYYHEGIQIFDISDPENVEQVAYYDTEPDNTNYSGFMGAWGAYPFLPSGRIIGSDTRHGLFVLSADSIEFEPITATTFPEISLNETSDLQICEDSSVTLSANATSGAIEWFQSGDFYESNTEIEVAEAGTYFAKATDQHCITYSDALTIDITPLPEIANIPDQMLCEGEVFQIPFESNGNNFILFSVTSEAIVDLSDLPEFEIAFPDEYQVISTINDCPTLSNPFTLSHVEEENLSWWLSGEYEICSNDTLFLEIPETDATLSLLQYNQPEQSVEAGQLSLMEDGTYQIMAINGQCQTESDELKLETQQVVTPFAYWNETNQTLVASPAPSYQWFKDGQAIGGATYYKLKPSGSGIYTVRTYDFFGCKAFSNEVEVDLGQQLPSLQTGNDQLETIAVFPNPTKGYIQIKGNYQSFELVNPNGQILKRGNQVAQIDLSQWPAGSYWLRIFGESQTEIVPIVKLP